MIFNAETYICVKGVKIGSWTLVLELVVYFLLPDTFVCLQYKFKLWRGRSAKTPTEHI